MGIIFSSLLVGVGIVVFKLLAQDLPSPESLQTYTPPLTTKVFDAKNRLICEFFEERREPVPLDSIPPFLVESLLAVEDKRFFKHWGLSFRDLIRAFIVNLTAGRVIQGASTITQQLARNMFLSLERTIQRKLKESILAVRLERLYSKEEILEMYLNQVYFGHGAYGVEAAAQTYFGKPVHKLNLPQCAMLAAIAKAPGIYSPYNNPERCKERRDFFIKKLWKIGKISQEEYEKAINTPLGVIPRKPPKNEAPYFVEKIRRYLEAKYGSHLIYKMGVYIYTTLDLDMQRIANKVVEENLRAIEERRNLHPKKIDFDINTIDSTQSPPYLQASLVALDVKTGHILAYVGGRDFSHSQFDRVIQAKRQPGSSFKTFVYTAAIDNGFSPSDIEIDGPVMVKMWRRIYAPQNWDRQFMGAMCLRKALALSRNTIAVKLTRYLSPQTVSEYAKKMGIQSPLNPVLSLGLGTSDVNLLEMTTAFAILPRQGKKLYPIFIRRIVDREGRIIEENNPPEEKQVISPQTTFLVTNMLQSVIDAGTAKIIRGKGFQRPAAGKTGTTDDFTDGWFIGFTPDVVCGVWVGFDEKRPIYPGAAGGSVSAPIWADFMQEALKDYPISNFEIPEEIVLKNICLETGDLATPYCPHVRAEYFKEDRVSTQKCEYHRLLYIQQDTSRLLFEELDKRKRL